MVRTLGNAIDMIYTSDVFLHTWDLARATGQDVQLDLIIALDDPDGDAWVMKSVSLIIDPHQTYDAMSHLGERLQLPAGWSYRAVTLVQDLVLTPENGTARILQDDVGNTYDRVAGPFSNYKP